MVLMEGRGTSLRSWLFVATLAGGVLAGGCAKVSFKPNAEGESTGAVTERSSTMSTSGEGAASRPSLMTIVNRDLQNGRYAEGEKALKRYLDEHPGDRTAQFFLRQLTEDPKQALGSASSPHVVQAGESYSTLAAKYLGDPNLFLVLARYNGSTNPSLIRVGSTLQMPGSQSASATTADAAASVTPVPQPVANAVAAVSTASPAQRAQQLETQSLALYRQGHRAQAVALLDQALALNPQLKSSDPDFPALSRAWVANSHQQAMVFYLDQRLDQAIALWNRILIVDPGYEPAVVYRTRALELKQRLQQY